MYARLDSEVVEEEDQAVPDGRKAEGTVSRQCLCHGGKWKNIPHGNRQCLGHEFGGSARQRQRFSHEGKWKHTAQAVCESREQVNSACEQQAGPHCASRSSSSGPIIAAVKGWYQKRPSFRETLML